MQAMSNAPKLEGSPRERLLKAADELFYAHGVHTVGIDRVIERAGVAKASLYSTFGSKEELVRAYLDARGAARRQQIQACLMKQPGARRKILAVFDFLEDLAGQADFRGCAFVNASAEEAMRAGPVRAACDRSREWVRGLFSDLAVELGAKDPERLGRRLAMLYHATINAASMDSDPTAAREAREMAELVIDSELTARARGTPPSSHRSPRGEASASSRKR
jgi:AcrR family transcriptional regulator